ncbi:MAG: hypothetical protein MZU79_00680 [Anaerotruncus sp.]|nr:hypothetical protein [Anaerotruncus sp.]
MTAASSSSRRSRVGFSAESSARTHTSSGQRGRALAGAGITCPAGPPTRRRPASLTAVPHGSNLLSFWLNASRFRAACRSCHDQVLVPRADGRDCSRRRRWPTRSRSSRRFSPRRR